MGKRSHKGYFCLILHAHLPYIRHPEHDYFLEENWLYEAITETYIPLLDVFSRLINDGIDFRITLSLSPTLVEMLNDSLLMDRYKRHIENILELSDKEVYRTKGDIHFEPVARMYYERFRRVRYLFEDLYQRDLVSAFRALQDAGNVELMSSAATHAFLPNLSIYPQAVKAQIKTGIRHYKKIYGIFPGGIWLPECGFAAGFDNYIREEGIRFFFLDTHGVIHGKPVPRYSVYAPIICPSGIAAFGRDVETSRQVWSSVEGYPGDYSYRDFYRDIGFDLDTDYLSSFLRPYGTRTFTGIKYYRITGKTDRKEPYILQRAMDKALEHADNFIMKRELQVHFLSETLKINPVITATYDAELFGHWWFEGPVWLEYIFRGMCLKQRNFRAITPSEYLSLSRQPEGFQECEPTMSSWGDKGYSEVWLNVLNDYVYRHLLRAAERMIYLSGRFPRADGLLRRALNQAAREVLLSQQSDWTFIIKNQTATDYAKKRLEEHISRFNFIYQSIISENIPEKWLTEIEEKDRLFPEIDYSVYGSNQ